MSTPNNPLDSFDTYSYKHVLVAFKYTEDAEQTVISPSLGATGDVITGIAAKGPGIIIANEFAQSDFIIHGVKWMWDYFSIDNNTTPACIGTLELTDRTGLHFINFMRTVVVPKLGVSQGHMVFALRTFFLGKNYQNTNNDIIAGNPLIFNMVTDVDELSVDAGRFYTMSFVGASTTFAQLNQFSKIYQMTITHSDGNLHKEKPQPKNATCSLSSRQDEDALQNDARKTRIDKSKPMRNLKEVFDAFAVELNQQKYVNAAQLQSWLSHVRDNYVPKMPPPIQNKVGGIPVNYFIHLDPIYNTYDVDNRNLPFEQPEQDQNKKGIRSIPVSTGTDITDQVIELMKLSRQVGADALNATKQYIFKTIVSTIKNKNDGYDIHISIRRVLVPKNRITLNTGPGEDPLVPLEFTYQDPSENKDTDIISINIRAASDVGLGVLEKSTLPTESLVIYGDREQITSERIPDISFFEAQYSGLRGMNSNKNFGLESGVDASKVDDCLDVDMWQSTAYDLVIAGNPYLLSDINRTPSNVANNEVGTVYYYKYPESNPMYVKLNIFLAPHAAIGINQNENVAYRFFFQNYYHLHRVVNIFENGMFLQQLCLLRGDEAI